LWGGCREGEKSLLRGGRGEGAKSPLRGGCSEGDQGDPAPGCLQAHLGRRQQPPGLLVVGDRLIERCRRIGEALEGGLQAVQELIQGWAPVVPRGNLGSPHATISATFPSTPFTKRPDSSPENVLASSMDSLIAAFTGTLRAIVIS
jgi:hypothetical protein